MMRLFREPPQTRVYFTSDGSTWETEMRTVPRIGETVALPVWDEDDVESNQAYEVVDVIWQPDLGFYEVDADVIVVVSDDDDY